MKKIIASLFILFSLSMLFCIKSTKENRSNVNKYKNTVPKVLIVHSKEQDHIWTKQVDVGIKNFISNKGYEIETVYMGLTLTSDNNAKEKAGAQAMDKFKSMKAHIVLAVDDDAQKYFAQKLVKRDDVDIVFCGVENDPSDYNYPVSNVTGILKRPNLQKTIALLNQAIPGVTTYTLLADGSHKSNIMLKYLKGMNLGFNIKTIQCSSHVEWKAAVENINTDAVILFEYREVEEITPGELLKWTVENLKVPSVAFDEDAIKAGIMLGKIDSGYEHGQLAAQSINMIIDGKKPIQIVVSVGREGITLANKSTAAKMNADLTNFKVDKEY